MKNSPKQGFQKERKNTDESLGAEREKTNRSIAEAKGKVELQTNESVQDERSNTDLATTAAREKADSIRDIERIFDGASNNLAIDERTQDERLRFDAAVELERTRVDIAIDLEREVKSKIQSQFIKQEREQTDKNLAVERTRTDTVVLTVGVELSEEVAAHLKTKFSLTTRDEFLAIVSHDLRNPIGAISSSMEMLLSDTTTQKFNDDTVGWLQLAKRNADSALRLINDLLDMERVAKGKLEMTFIPCDIGEVIQESIDRFVHITKTKNVVVTASAGMVSGEIKCDRERIMQVLSNLIGNAIKFTPAGGKINLDLEWTPKNVTVSVRDTGPGIPDDKKNHIFERFAQLESKDRTGLGLGLHISKMLVEAHNGKIWVESKPNEGSVFYVQLPTLS